MFEIYDAWSSRFLLRRFSYQEAIDYCDTNEPPVSKYGPWPRYTVLPARLTP